MTLKLDISKAYDNVDWAFLYKGLDRIGFNNQIIGMIKTMVKNVNYLVLMDGTPWGFFGVARGLRKGNPIPTYLFIMVIEVMALLHTS